MQVFGNILFFSIGEWSGSGDEYWADLSTSSSAKLVTKLNSYQGDIIEVGSSYLLADAWSGDVCGSGATFYSFDMGAKQRGEKLATVGYGCMPGYTEVGVDKENRMLLPYTETADICPTRLFL